MKVCGVGAGAIGGLLAVRLAESGEEVTVVDQGAHLQAIQRHGLKLIMADGSEFLVHTGDLPRRVGASVGGAPKSSFGEQRSSDAVPTGARTPYRTAARHPRRQGDALGK